MENLESISVYELFPKQDDQNYYAIHTLIQLFNSNKEFLKNYHIKNLNKTIDKINSIRNHFSELSINPYLILKNLNGNEEDILKKLNYEIFPNLFEEELAITKIKKIKDPSKDENFMKNLLSAIKSEGNSYSKEFKNPSRAEELFYFYADKNHIPLLVKDLKLISGLYNQSCNAKDSW